MNKLKSIVVMLVFMSQVAWGMDINPTLSGSWYNPDQSGHGLAVEVMNDQTTIVYWYVYHPDGTPMFLITVGENQGNRVTGKTYYNTGMKFGEFNPDDRVQTVWGTTTVTFDDCTTASLSYSSDDPAYGSGKISMTRLNSIEGVKCSNNPLQDTYHLTLFDGTKVAFGMMWVFENGYTSFFAASDTGGIMGIGQATITGSERFELEFTAFDLFGGGWSEEFAAGEYSEGYINVNFDGGSLVGTNIHNFQKGISYNSIADTYDIKDVVTSKVIGTITLGAEGNVNGNTFSGCSITGWYSIPDTQFNQIYTELSLSGCSMNPDMRGAGNVGDEIIGFAMTDYYNGQIWFLTK